LFGRENNLENEARIVDSKQEVIQKSESGLRIVEIFYFTRAMMLSYLAAGLQVVWWKLAFFTLLARRPKRTAVLANISFLVSGLLFVFFGFWMVDVKP
jgi:hypothetical protein